MTNNSIRIRTNVGSEEKYIKTKLDQDFDFIEVLSLKISQEEAYRNFCSDYGAVIGRVTVNAGSFGVENAKVSIFIPVSDEDKLNRNIFNLYPYETVYDRNIDGIRYNLLPKKERNNNKCYTNIGTFTTKREVLDNEVLTEIHEKYYKFTSVTNKSGDFMIFGIPVGNYIIHVDADISNIGILSQRPYDLIEQGAPPKQFDGPTKFKGSKNIDNLPQVKTLNYGVEVKPFWGDTNNCEVGINRVDFDLNYTVVPKALFMGSIFSDNEKNSINKNCRPRKASGLLCETVTSEGTVEMIRKNIDDEIEKFDINGGRVIDPDGTWNYQIPMNLDYVITAEDGSTIPSDDPSRGIPTRARVRFRIGMDETGGEGRIRTRAKFLVPNNPISYSKVNFDFDEDTPDENFTDLHWNQIYTVKSFIPRYQKRSAGKKDRNTTAVKDVDACGSHTPFPYNKARTESSGLFILLCTIAFFFQSLIGFINGLLIPIINGFLKAINSALKLLCNTIWRLRFLSANKQRFCAGKYNDADKTCNCKEDILKFAPCVVLECGTDQVQTYAPGCGNSEGLTAAKKETKVNHWNKGILTSGDCGHAGHDAVGSGAGFVDCYAAQLAEELDLIKFWFFNDWINGTLYAQLLKYKFRKRNGRDKYCDYDCADNVENKCNNNELIDVCIINENTDASVRTKNGIVIKYKDVLYYGPITSTGGYKLFATDIVNLGSMLDCNFMGTPKIIDFISPTSYKLPPLLTSLDDENRPAECGIVATGGGNSSSAEGLFFSINCFGLNVLENKGCNNLKRICELGVDIDEAQFNQDTLEFIASANCVIQDEDIANQFVRNQFALLNKPENVTYHNSDFTFNENYLLFKGSEITGGYSQPKNNSYYFYFGIKPGNTALDKANKNYFVKCDEIIEDDFIILATATPSDSLATPNGTITFSFVGGQANFDYIITGPNNYSINGNTGYSGNTITGLNSGVYIITATDEDGKKQKKQVYIDGPQSLFCDVVITKYPTNNSTSDGEILITQLGGGLPDYTITITKNNNIINNINNQSIQLGDIITGLPYGNLLVEIKDQLNIICSNTIELTTADAIDFSIETDNLSCFESNDGSISISINNGQAPFTTSTVGPDGYTSSQINQNNLKAGTYSVIVTDSANQTSAGSTAIYNKQPIVLTYTNITDNSCGITRTASLSWTNGDQPFTIYYDNTDSSNSSVVTTNNGSITIVLPTEGETEIWVEDKNGCVSNPVYDRYIKPDPQLKVIGILNVESYTTGSFDGSGYALITIWFSVPTGSYIPSNLYEGFRPMAYNGTGWVYTNGYDATFNYFPGQTSGSMSARVQRIGNNNCIAIQLNSKPIIQGTAGNCQTYPTIQNTEYKCL